MGAKPDQESWIDRARHSNFVVTALAIVAVITYIGTATDAFEKFAVMIGLRADALQVAADKDARAHFSRELSRAAWYRVWLMYRYVALVKEKNSDADKERVWSKYTEVLEDWNRDLLVNDLSLKQYYGDRKRNELMRRIQPQFASLHRCLEVLRTPTSSFSCSISPDKDIAAIEKALHRLQHDIYCFATAFPEPATLADLFGQKTKIETSCKTLAD